MLRKVLVYLTSIFLASLLKGSLGQFNTAGAPSGGGQGGGRPGGGLATGDNSMVKAQQALFTGQANFRAAFSADLYRFIFPPIKKDPASGGSINLFNLDTDPALYVTKTGQNLVHVSPCGLVQPHLHPRSSEFSFIITGELVFGLVEENGPKQRAVNYTLKAGQGIFIPQGYIHFAQNQGSKPASFIANFGTEDFGLVTINKQFFRIPPISLAATLNSSIEFAEKVAKSAQQQNVVTLLKDCKPETGIPTSQQMNPNGEMVQWSVADN